MPNPLVDLIKEASMLDLVQMKLSLLSALELYPDSEQAKQDLELVKEALKARNYVPLFPGGEPF